MGGAHDFDLDSFGACVKEFVNNLTDFEESLQNGHFLSRKRNTSDYWVVKTPGISMKRVREVPDITENWVEEYGKFNTGEEKDSGSFEEKGTGVLTCLGGERRKF